MRPGTEHAPEKGYEESPDRLWAAVMQTASSVGYSVELASPRT